MVEKLKEYAAQLSFKDLEERLEKIAAQLRDSKAPLVLPLVGEFSAGKTTLINAVSDSKALACASAPTTATIYTLHFSAPDIKAVIHYQDGTEKETSDISTLDNKQLADALYVDVFDTSSKIPSSVMLVDTPGISSHDIKHRQNLVDFLPQADGVLLVVDVNQPITRSLTEFAKTIALSKRPLYMVLTQCDTKSRVDVDAQKQYILNHTELHLSDVVCVSAKTNDLAEFYQLLDTIQVDKARIIKQVSEGRCKEIAQEMLQRIDVLLAADESDEQLEEELQNQQSRLARLRRDIDNITKDIEFDIENEGRQVSRRFEDLMLNRLDAIVAGASNNYDAEAMSAINNTSSLLLNDYKTAVAGIFARHAEKCEGLSSLDLSAYSMEGMSGCYNLGLNEVGHEYDSLIGQGLSVVVGAAAVAGGNVGTAMQGVNAFIGQNSGLVNSIVGLVTDQTMGRPQRRRAIRQYIDDTLSPSFQSEISRIGKDIVNRVNESINSHFAASVETTTEALERLRDERQNKRQEYVDKMNILKTIKKGLSVL